MDLKKWISQQSRRISQHLSYMDGYSKVYHISTNPKIKACTPMIGTRQLPSEDRTIPRVCCASSIVDAVRGHAAVSGQAINRWKTGEAGVFYIYQFPFTEYAKPDTTLVPDSDLTSELWVVPNSAQTSMFTAPIVGEFFVSSVSEEYEDGVLEHEFTLSMHTTCPVRLNERLELNGYGSIEFKRESAMNAQGRANGHVVESIEALSAAEYQKALSSLIRNTTKG